MLSPPHTKRFQICNIEPVRELVDGSFGSAGSLGLSRVDDNYQIHFTIDKTSLTQLMTRDAKSPSNISKDKWKPNGKFKVNCSKLSTLQLHQNPLSLTIGRTDKTIVRTFAFNPSEFSLMTDFIEQLIINGITVIGPDFQKNDKYILIFYRGCRRNLYSFIPPHIQLSTKNKNTDLDIFWESLHKFFTALMVHLDKCNSIPKDPTFPLNLGIEANNEQILKKIHNFISNFQNSDYDINNCFNDKGQINNFDQFKQYLFFNGIDIKKLHKYLPIICGLFEPNSTYEQRNIKFQDLKDEFYQLYSQTCSLTETQILHHKSFFMAFSVIDGDVRRTNRQHQAFSRCDSIGFVLLERLLKTYCIYNPPIGYLQGMNEIMASFIFTYFFKWTHDGIPIFDDYEDDINNFKHTIISPITNNEKTDLQIEYYLPHIFWCFESMLKNLNHMMCLTNVNKYCEIIAGELQEILEQASPLVSIWMKRNGINSLIWLCSDIILLFKKTFDYDIQKLWNFWVQLNCFPQPDKSLVYFIASLIIHCFKQFSSFTTVTILTMMEAFPKIIESVDFKEVSMTMIWLYENAPLRNINDNEECNENITSKKFRFFETYWTGPSEATETC